MQKKDSNRDHSKSNKMPLAQMIFYTALDVVSLNPVGLASDVARLAQAGKSAVSSSIYGKDRNNCETDKKNRFLTKK